MSSTKIYSDEELISGCINNDRKLQKALYDKYFHTMFGMCMKHLKNQDEALEVLNEGFFKVMSKIHTFGSKGSFEGWIRRVIYNCIIDFFNTKNKSVQYLELDNLEHHSSNLNTGYDNLTFADIENLVEQLPSASKNVFLKFVMYGFDHKQIAEEMNISIGTSKWHLSNAREMLKIKLSKLERYEKKIS
jgi:RNA polymerase sigma factor (sigma-70 family)